MAYASRGDPPRAVVLCAQSISFVDASALAVLQEMVASWKLRKINFYVACAYGLTQGLLEATLGPSEPRLQDCARSIDACLLAEASQRRPRVVSVPNLFRSSLGVPRARAANPGLKVGFARSLPSFHDLSEVELA
mmetsp:Transcript_13888/g.41359  ORF Transcript_13888/g.41359 Transcript_13888/m.41359 type:complete len:135 (+) Transcript_13888:1852-2256(+)